MPHKCYGGCGTYISDDRVYCVNCEKERYGNGGVTDDEELETSGDDSDDRDDPGFKEER